MAGQDEGGRDDESAADVARDQAVRMLVSMGIQVGVLLAVSWTVQHEDELKFRGRRLLARARGRRPADTGSVGLQVREFAVAVSNYDHGDRA
jgi:hypothetical protein